jgi:hypothetical protein
MTDFNQILSREIETGKIAKKDSGKNISNKKVPAKNKKTAVLKSKKKSSTAKKNSPKENKKKLEQRTVLSKETANPIWLSLTEAAKIGGLDKKTIKRAIKKDLIKYKIVDNRYQVEFRSAILFLLSRKKLWNKLNETGIGQYIEKWME